MPAPVANMAPSDNNGFRKRKTEDVFGVDDKPVDLGPVASYNPLTQETYPEAVTLSEEWAIFQKGKEFLHELITSPLKNGDFSNQITEGLLKKADKRILRAPEELIHILINGQMGTGKSATLNSILQSGVVAREGDDGSCTQVPHLYQYKQKDQSEPFLAVVRFFPSEAIRQILQRELAAYHAAFHNRDHDGSAPDKEDADIDLDVRNNIANNFYALFCDHSECASPQLVREYLETAESEDDVEILEKLCDWADALIRNVTGGTKKTYSIGASTANQLLVKLTKFQMSAAVDGDEDEPSPWPFVSLIMFHFDDPLLKLGVSFLDTPGTSDANHTRQLNAIAHRKKCTHVAQFGDPARARDDKHLSQDINKYKNRGEDHILVILPKCEMLNDNTIPEGSRTDKDKVKLLRQLHTAADKELQMLESQMASIDYSQAAQVGMLYHKKTVLEVKLKRRENEEKAHRIEMRNKQNRIVISEKLKDVTNFDTPIPVISVSNECYRKLLHQHSPKNAPTLSATQTGVPKLREWFSKTPNVARLNEMKHQQDSLLPAMISQCNLYISRTHMQRKEDLMDLVSSPGRRYPGFLDKFITRFEQDIQSNVIEILKKEEVDWSRRAGNLIETWFASNSTAQLLSLMKRDGRRKTSKRNTEMDMSGDLIRIKEAAARDISGKALRAHTAFQKTLREEAVYLCNDMMTTLMDDQVNAPFVALEAFYKHVQHRVPTLTKHIGNVMDELLDGLNNIIDKVSSADEGAYLVKAMLPVYAKVRLLKGGGKGSKAQARPKGGWPLHRNLIFKQEVTRYGNIWDAVVEGVDTDFKHIVKGAKDSLYTGMGKVFAGFVEAFDSLCETEEKVSPQEAELRFQLGENLKKAEEHLNGPMKAAVEKLLLKARTTM